MYYQRFANNTTDNADESSSDDDNYHHGKRQRNNKPTPKHKSKHTMPRHWGTPVARTHNVEPRSARLPRPPQPTQPPQPPQPPRPPHSPLENPAYFSSFAQLLNHMAQNRTVGKSSLPPPPPPLPPSQPPSLTPSTQQTIQPTMAPPKTPQLPPLLQHLQNIEGIEIIPLNFDIGGSSGSSPGLRSMNPTEQLISQLLKQRMMKKAPESETEDEPDTDAFVVDPNKEYKIIDQKIETLDDLIGLCDFWKEDMTEEYNIDLKRLSMLKEPLTKLKNVIGMDKVKKQIVQHVIYFLQGYGRNEDMLHMTIQGPPGTGKTMIGEILGEIYFKLGIIKGKPKKNKDGKPRNEDELIFKKVRRSDLIGEYLGHTAVKTQKIIDECEGGVLFIDEAYSLGNKEGKDNFSKECIDTINQNLTEKKNKFVCIVAGYPDELDSCFFSYNPGLRRRFPFNYTIDPYTEKELEAIFRKKVEDNKWSINPELSAHLSSFMKKNKEHFPHYGGDIETLFFICKMGHAMRTLNCHPRERTILTILDLENGFSTFKHNREIIGYKQDKTHYSYYT